MLPYAYVVNGQSYRVESAAIAYGYDVNWYDFESAVVRDGASRATGATVRAYYDAGNPSRSVLDRATFDPVNAINLRILILVLANIVDFRARGDGVSSADVIEAMRQFRSRSH